MALEPLAKFGGYYELNDGIHRKAADPLGHPALARHLGFWEVDRRSEPRRTRAIKAYLLKLTNRLLEAGCTEINSPSLSDLRPYVRSRYLSFHFRWVGIYTTVRFEVTTEYVTCAVLFDFSIMLRSPLFSNIDVWKSSGMLGIDFGRTLFEFTRDVGEGRQIPEEIYDRLFTVIWDTFEEDILDHGGMCGSSLGAYFADFRGVITGDLYPLPSGWDPACIPPVQYPFKFAASTYPSPTPKSRGRENNNINMSPSWCRAAADRIIPFMLMKAPDFELTISAFLGRRVVYVSALGPQSAHKPQPVHYYIHSATDGEWQIGRLLDRFLTLGMLRLAATIQANDLYKASFRLNRVENIIGDCQNLLRELIVKTRQKEGLEIEKRQQSKLRSVFGLLPAPVRARRREIVTKIDELDRVIRVDQSTLNSKLETLRAAIQKMERQFDGNIDDRLKQSCYYIEKFKSDLVALRINRIEGFQPYNEFVLRRLGGTFSFVEAMADRMSTYRQNRLLLNDLIINLGIRHVERENMTIVTDLDEQNRIMKEIQDIGEIVLFCVIAPYYLNDTLFQMFEKGARPESCEFRVWLLTAILAGCFFSALRLSSGLVHAYNHHEWNHFRRQILKYVCVSIIGVAALLGFFPRLHWPVECAARVPLATELQSRPSQKSYRQQARQVGSNIIGTQTLLSPRLPCFVAAAQSDSTFSSPIVSQWAWDCAPVPSSPYFPHQLQPPSQFGY